LFSSEQVMHWLKDGLKIEGFTRMKVTTAIVESMKQ
jgi:hypothetical protein